MIGITFFQFRFKSKALSIQSLILSLFLSSTPVSLSMANENISSHNEIIIKKNLRSFQKKENSSTFYFYSGVAIEGILAAQQIAISITSTYLASHLMGGHPLRQTAKHFSYIGLLTNIFDGVAAAQELWSGQRNENYYFSGFLMGHSLTKVFLKNPITLLTDALIENIFPLLNRNTLFSTALSIFEWGTGKSSSLTEKSAALDDFEKGSNHYNQFYRIVGGVISSTTLIYITKTHLFDEVHLISTRPKTPYQETSIKDPIEKKPAKMTKRSLKSSQSKTSGSSENSRTSPSSSLRTLPPYAIKEKPLLTLGRSVSEASVSSESSKESTPLHSICTLSPKMEVNIIHKKIRIKTKGNPFILVPEEKKNTESFAAQTSSHSEDAATSLPMQSTRLLFLRKSDNQALENLLTLAPRSNYHHHLSFSKLDSFLGKLGVKTISTKGSKFSISLDGVVIGGSEKGHSYSGPPIVKNYDGVHTALRAIAQQNPAFRGHLELEICRLGRENFWEENDRSKKK